MKLLSKSALFLFVITIVAFTSLLFVNSYKLEKKSLKEIGLTDAQINNLSIGLDKISTVEYTSKLKFISDLKMHFNDANAKAKNNENWDLVVYDLKSKIYTITKQSSKGFATNNSKILFWIIFIVALLSSLIHIIPRIKLDGHPGIKNDNITKKSLTSRGWVAMLLTLYLLLFYSSLYWSPAYIAEWVILLNEFSMPVFGVEASQWFVYGFFYTFAILVMGTKFIIKYRHNRYQIIRTLSIMFFQLIFAFVLPNILISLSLPYADLKNIWPLDYTFFFDWHLNDLISSGTFGIFILFWGIALIIVAVPLFTYFFGKRWYCSWVCGCGGLAETAGDQFRHLSVKKFYAWKIERWLIHSVLLFSVIMTSAVLYSYFTESSKVLGIDSYKMREVYGFLIGALFAGVIGTVAYPIFGNRVWCRFSCPLAAYLGIFQRYLSRFRITTNGGQCMSCGNCSTYCEMGIDVRMYAQRGQNVVRASCVGCGICSAVCPRGVLRLENSSPMERTDVPKVLLGNNSFKK